MKIFAILFLFSSTGMAVPAKIDASRADDFLQNVCKVPDREFSQAWLKHEEKFWDFYEPTFYSNEKFKQMRKQLADEMSERRSEMCKYTRTFLMVAPAIIGALSVKVAELVGSKPMLPLHLVSALQWTDGRGSEYKGQRVYVFNARHDSYSRTTGMAATIAHELIHSATAKREAKSRRSQRDKNFVDEALYHEGLAVFGTQILFPEVGDSAVGIKPDELVRAEKSQSQVAKELIVLWDKPISDEKSSEYFAGGWKGEIHPPKMGYFLGLKIFRKIAEDLGTQKTMRLLPSEFKERARGILQALTNS